MTAAVKHAPAVNYERVGKGFRILTQVLNPFVCRELVYHFREGWWNEGVIGTLHESLRQGLPPSGKAEDLMSALDVAASLALIDRHWSQVFRNKLSREHRSWINELRNVRNKWAHPGLLDLSDDDAWRALDTMTRVVEQEDAEAAEKLRELAREIRYGTSGPSTHAPPDQIAPTSGREEGNKAGVLRVVPRSGLLPWREVARPHPDVAAGRYRQAEFVADLSQVARGTAEPEYQDPVEFFARTFVTESMGTLLAQALERVSGRGGEPVIQLKTAFGGGKTHTLLALYHLLGGRVPEGKVEAVDQLVRRAGLDGLPQAKVAVLVGTALNPTKERRPPQLPGIVIRTLWGEIAAQLAQQSKDLKLFDHVREADRKGVPAGSDALRELFDAAGPTLILVDELLAYARKIYGISGLPSGTFEAVLTFVQELTEAVRMSPKTLLVATIPESDIEVGGEAGREALIRLEHTFGRMESIWKPVGAEEGFEVVRRRLFLPVQDLASRDDVCRAFSQLYLEHAADFPSECRERRYLERLKACYPIHPEVFDRLYHDWASLDRFQRTRGVLRLMAGVIHDLWVRQDAGVMIMPGSIASDAVPVREELLRYLTPRDAWGPVVESDVDGRRSTPYRIDAENPYFGQVMAARRVARTIFLGSAPHASGMQVRGLEEIRMRLGVVQPGEGVPVFNDALDRLNRHLTYLYRSNQRCWYDLRPNLRRTVEDRAAQIHPEAVNDEIARRLKTRERAEFSAVHVFPSPEEVPDECAVRLIVLRPEQSHKANEAESPAIEAAKQILETRAGGPRQFRNMLAFVAPDLDAVAALEQEVRRHLAWVSIVNDEALNLDRHQVSEAKRGVSETEAAATRHIQETFIWLVLPSQDGSGPIEWDIARVAGSESPVAKTGRRMKSSEALIAKWSPALLRMELDRWFWKDEDHVSIKRVWEALCSYCYLPRLAEQQVFVDAVREGIRSRDFFAFAADVDEDGQYRGVAIGHSGAEIFLDAAAVLVRPEAVSSEPGVADTWIENDLGVGPQATPPEDPDPGTGPSRFYGSIQLDPRKLGREAGTLAMEVLQHLDSILGSEVKVTVEIEAKIPNGVPEHLHRTVSENCRSLRFQSFGFEKE